MVAAICSAAFALILWNLVERSPRDVASDIAAGARHARTFVQGFLRTAVGLIFASLALVLVATTIAYGTADLFSIFSIGTFLAGLTVDALIGDAVRRIMGIKR